MCILLYNVLAVVLLSTLSTCALCSTMCFLLCCCQCCGHVHCAGPHACFWSALLISGAHMPAQLVRPRRLADKSSKDCSNAYSHQKFCFALNSCHLHLNLLIGMLQSIAQCKSKQFVFTASCKCLFASKQDCHHFGCFYSYM